MVKKPLYFVTGKDEDDFFADDDDDGSFGWQDDNDDLEELLESRDHGNTSESYMYESVGGTGRERRRGDYEGSKSKLKQNAIRAAVIFFIMFLIVILIDEVDVKKNDANKAAQLPSSIINQTASPTKENGVETDSPTEMKTTSSPTTSPTKENEVETDSPTEMKTTSSPTTSPTKKSEVETDSPTESKTTSSPTTSPTKKEKKKRRRVRKKRKQRIVRQQARLRKMKSIRTIKKYWRRRMVRQQICSVIKPKNRQTIRLTVVITTTIMVVMIKRTVLMRSQIVLRFLIQNGNVHSVGRKEEHCNGCREENEEQG